MKLSDVTKRLQAPFPKHMVSWKPGAIAKDRKRALLMAFIDARAVMDRLDATLPDDWSFRAVEIPGAKVPTMRGTLTVLGVSRSDVGEGDPTSEAGNSYKAASSDALKRCAVHFGIGRYLYDLPKVWVEWDDAKRKPAQEPELPEWARPDHERTPGGAHLVQVIDQLKIETGACQDVEQQREIYKHLKNALSALHPAPRSREPESEGDPAPRTSTPVRPGQASNPVVGGISTGTKRQLAAHLEGPRWGFTSRERRVDFTAWLAGVSRPIGSSGELTEQEGLDALRIVERCPDPEAKVAEWQAELGHRVA